ncbi:hypothetical protein EAI77_02495 [Ligilactobacillus ruminis]|nr:hypothetical protein EAI77_02495 [Ligilactobacillus ruminis]
MLSIIPDAAESKVLKLKGMLLFLGKTLFKYQNNLLVSPINNALSSALLKIRLNRQSRFKLCILTQKKLKISKNVANFKLRASFSPTNPTA